MNFRIINIFVFFYLTLILLAYQLTNYQLFDYLFYNFFDGSLDFFPEDKASKVKNYLPLLDDDFLFFVPIIPLIIYSINIIFNFNKIIFPNVCIF